MLLGIIIIVYILYFIIKTFYETKSMPPGPFPLPLIGNLFQIGLDPPVTMDTLWMTYGDMYRITLPVGTSVIVNSAEVTHEALVTRKNDFAGRPRSIMYPVDVIFEGRDIVTADFDEAFVSRKKMMNGALRCLGPRFNKEGINGAIQDILDLVGTTEGKPFSLKPYVQSAVVSHLWEGISSRKRRLGDPILTSLIELIEDISSFSSQGNLYQLVPFLRHFPTPNYAKRLKQVITTRDDIFRPMITAHRHSYQKGVVNDVTDAFLAAFEGVAGTQPKNIDKDIVHCTMNILFGGSTTTTAIITWFALYVALDSGLQSKLQAELDHVVNDDGVPSWEDIERFPLLQSTLCEIVRHSPFMPFLIPHKTTRKTTLKGYHLPKNTMVLFNLYRIHRDPAKWTEPSFFKPDRFIDADGGFVGWSRIPKFIPFGLGARSCPGKALGKMQIILIAASLLHRFTIMVDPECKPNVCDSVPGAIRYPKDYKLVATKRTQRHCLHNGSKGSVARQQGLDTSREQS